RGSDSHGRQSRALHRRSLTQRALSSGASPDLTAELAAIQLPVLVLAGDEDEGYGISIPSTAVSQRSTASGSSRFALCPVCREQDEAGRRIVRSSMRPGSRQRDLWSLSTSTTGMR